MIRNFIIYARCALAFSPFFIHEICSAQVIGVGTHFGQKREYIQQLLNWSKDTPITSIRDEIYWKDVERVAGQLKIEGRASYALRNITQAAQAGLRPLIILSYGNPHYDSGGHPTSIAAREAFARYATFIYRETKHLDPIFEIWNEWNIGAGSNPKTKSASPETYVELTKTTASALRSAGYKGIILGGALGDDHPNWPWASKAISLGLLEIVDGISIHLYNYSNKTNLSGASEFIDRTQRLQEIISNLTKLKSYPLYITEIGWPNHFGLKSVSLEKSAIEAEIMLNEAANLPYIKGIWFYEFQDSGADPLEKEHHFGLLDRDYREKPISCTLRKWGEVQAKTNWTSIEKRNGITINIGKRPDGTRLMRIWPSPKPGYAKAKFILPKTKYSEISHMPTDSNCTKPDISENIIIPTDRPTLVTTQKGGDSPNPIAAD